MRDSNVRRLSQLHRIVYQMTGGVIGRRLVNNAMLLLTTTGRHSGTPHAVPLLYLRDRHRFVVIASYGGRPHHPDWYLNLAADPTVEVQIRHRRFRASASTAGSEDRLRWWPQVVDAYGGYLDYQARTDRPIPVVFLDPI
ncbi:MAG: nitroreductase family deazaflavin-dependent oxidoreductase [Acidimicrobiia bacterium]|nr:nitroreductase family deazaflavin-dependent oxidoreductase [Acidimicrobiia bacterium]